MWLMGLLLYGKLTNTVVHYTVSGSTVLIVQSNKHSLICSFADLLLGALCGGSGKESQTS